MPTRLTTIRTKAGSTCIKTDEFWQDSVWLLDHIEKLVADASEERKRELIDIFVTGVENEYMFWASAYDMQYTWKSEWNQER